MHPAGHVKYAIDGRGIGRVGIFEPRTDRAPGKWKWCCRELRSIANVDRLGKKLKKILIVCHET